MRIALVALVATTCLLGLARRGVLLAADPAPADPAPAKAGDTITWVTPLTEGYAQAEKDKKPLMICINSERVDGGRVEAAAKELREVTYKDPAIVGRSRSFVCVFLTAEGSSDDFGELRARYQIEGLIVSPQHIFAYPDGKLIERLEYWSHGTGERSVKALVGLMDQALAKHKAASSLPATPTQPAPAPGVGPSPGAPAAPAPAAPAAEGDVAAWRAQLLDAIVKGPSETRKEALRRLLLETDPAKGGDGTNVKAVVELLPKLEEAKDLGAQLDVVRALGRPGLKGATAALVERLNAKDDDLRANVAVSLEYIGDPEAVDGLKGRLEREKLDLILCHLLRAIGRCGAGDDSQQKAVRALLDRRVGGAKTEATACAAIIGLAHFDGDAAAARALEDHLQKVGPPGGGRRGGGENTVKRVFLAWALAEIGDPKSAEVVRKKTLPALDNVQAFWVAAVREFYVAVAEVCEGKAEAMERVETGVKRTLDFARSDQWGPAHPVDLLDDARRDREEAGYVPKAEWPETGERSGGGAGAGGGGPGGGMPGRPPAPAK